ncbi:MAG: hypothetical protein OXJ52_02815, partial [Oligoflexia bacterium]|nr:hypothetical protein [Oligoflexia bacterium]
IRQCKKLKKTIAQKKMFVKVFSFFVLNLVHLMENLNSPNVFIQLILKEVMRLRPLKTKVLKRKLAISSQLSKNFIKE